MQYYLFILAVLIVGYIAFMLMREAFGRRTSRRKRWFAKLRNAKHRASTRPAMPKPPLSKSVARLNGEGRPRHPRLHRADRAGRHHAVRPVARQSWSRMQQDEGGLPRLSPDRAYGQNLKNVKTPWGW